jgi:hypothetical protein
MLYVIHCANHPNLSFRGGQEPILHLEADLNEVIRWAEADGRRWAFSLSNAGARYAEFRSRAEDLCELNWPAIAGMDFRLKEVREPKQAELLVHGRFPFELVTRIGVQSARMGAQVAAALASARHRPRVEVRANWYF